MREPGKVIKLVADARKRTTSVGLTMRGELVRSCTTGSGNVGTGRTSTRASEDATSLGVPGARITVKAYTEYGVNEDAGKTMMGLRRSTDDGRLQSVLAEAISELMADGKALDGEVALESFVTRAHDHTNGGRMGESGSEEADASSTRGWLTVRKRYSPPEIAGNNGDDKTVNGPTLDITCTGWRVSGDLNDRVSVNEYASPTVSSCAGNKRSWRVSASGEMAVVGEGEMVQL